MNANDKENVTMSRAAWVALVADEYGRCAVAAAFRGRMASQVERHLSREEVAALVRTSVANALTRALAAQDVQP